MGAGASCAQRHAACSCGNVRGSGEAQPNLEELLAEVDALFEAAARQEGEDVAGDDGEDGDSPSALRDLQSGLMQGPGGGGIPPGGGVARGRPDLRHLGDLQGREGPPCRTGPYAGAALRRR
ncbi:hypothetical protein HYH03_008753 [Edaphochlamys debaryana]|uniref:Uncharacterized protein n=1 Tax=Edaphochlamys debaryana TaxID=47281 RepID=A0A836BY05_9CHLO|nr:hypothetical protein HYH03_008753 [Edaphochlamys debaryana]|eukprot:KAG2493090.1 hypothetical protein HYH03_008753 [Edaphochlamys debaryana]